MLQRLVVIFCEANTDKNQSCKQSQSGRTNYIPKLFGILDSRITTAQSVIDRFHDCKDSEGCTSAKRMLLFPQMTDWLPDEDGAQLRFEFETEIRRLEAS